MTSKSELGSRVLYLEAENDRLRASLSLSSERVRLLRLALFQLLRESKGSNWEALKDAQVKTDRLLRDEYYRVKLMKRPVNILKQFTTEAA